MPFLEHVGRDLQFAIRQLRRSPGFALTAIATLALGIGAVTSVFSVVNAVLLKPFPFREPGQLIVVRETVAEFRAQMPVEADNYRFYLRLTKQAKSIEDAAIFSQSAESVSETGDRPRIVGAVRASANLFRVLGMQPMMGRDVAEGDAQKGAQPVVLLSYAGWQTFFRGDPKVVGKTLRLGGVPATVIGVVPPAMHMPRIKSAPGIEFREAPGTQETMVFEPLVPSTWDLKNDLGNFNYRVIARLRPCITLAQASAKLDTLERAYTLSARLPLHPGCHSVDQIDG